jgi:hypothetical protein
MKIFCIVYYHNYGTGVEIIIAKNKEDALTLVSNNAKGWGYSINEIPFERGLYQTE